MIGPRLYVCDSPGCGKTKTEVNGWFAVRTYSWGKIEVYTWDRATILGELEDAQHFCGSNHTLQFVSLVLGQKQEEL